MLARNELTIDINKGPSAQAQRPEEVHQDRGGPTSQDLAATFSENNVQATSEAKDSQVSPKAKKRRYNTPQSSPR